MQRLARARDDAVHDEPDDPARRRLGVPAEILPLADRVGAPDRFARQADADLEGVAVSQDLAGDELSDRLDGRRHVGRLAAEQVCRRRLTAARHMVDEPVDLGDVDVVLAEGSNQLRVDRRDDRLRTADAVDLVPHRRAEAAEPVGVGCRDLDQEDVGLTRAERPLRRAEDRRTA
jgi:hypothetical protein